MEKHIFVNVPLIKRSFLQRLFRQYPSDNAIIEVNNLLAIHCPQDISIQEIQAIQQKYEVDLGAQYGLNLQEFYAVLWNHYVVAEEWSLEFKQQANQLAVLFKLDPAVTTELKNKIGAGPYRQAAITYLSKRRLLTYDRASLEELASQLELSEEISTRIVAEQKQKVIDGYVKILMQKNRCTHDELREAERMTDNFQTPAPLKKQLLQQLRVLVSYWEAEHQPLSAIAIAEGVLQKNETCYFWAPNAQWYETRSRGYGSPELELINKGAVYVTSKRLMFIAEVKTAQIPLERILKVQMGPKGLNVIKDKGKNPVLGLGPATEILQIVITRVIAGEHS